MPHSLKEQAKPLDAASAFDVLAEYPRGDGLSLKELMDSSKNGGLTYNDFLMLPGHINFEVGLTRRAFYRRAFLLVYSGRRSSRRAVDFPFTDTLLGQQGLSGVAVCRV